MNPLVIRSLVLGIAVMGVSMPLHAQMMAPEPASSPSAETPVANTVAEVRTDGGVVMVSNGGPFQTAVPGQRVDAKARLMVSKESAATVIYDDGCKQTYDKPGVYPINETCVLPPPPVAAAGSSAGAPKWLIGTGVAIGLYAIVDSLNDNDNNDQLPVSR
ncbi:hypothetical protein [Dokdonella immobilis]|uniref:Secreted protein n=1 Tax=Dokdonella immobilis TaxID=578942 RepID=A0A1I4Y1P3_9GAMM|nr:hypothetical protein [Dokdonella immobilis]SFN31936.1 hypothetical protein SAMN05216289_11422 [Dokdonella immobilis]